MIIWLDAQLSPSIARWIAETFAVECACARDLGLRDALDPSIFAAARAAGANVMTKDADFANMVESLGPPPRVIWIRCGNTSNAALKDLLIRDLPECIARLADGDTIIELGQAPDSEPCRSLAILSYQCLVGAMRVLSATVLALEMVMIAEPNFDHERLDVDRLSIDGVTFSEDRIQ